MNIILYLGAQEKQLRHGLPHGKSVVRKIIKDLKMKGYNITKFLYLS